MARAEQDSYFRGLREEASKQGWVVEVTANGHWKFVPPSKNCRPCFFSGSPSDWRAIKNFVALMRRNGFRMAR